MLTKNKHDSYCEQLKKQRIFNRTVFHITKDIRKHSFLVIYFGGYI